MEVRRDAILISGVKASTRIGESALERSEWQTLSIDLRLEPTADFTDLRDDLSRTVNYVDVVTGIRKLVAAGERKLIETLAEEIANFVLANFPLHAVEVELKKFILAGVDYVAIQIRRDRAGKSLTR